MQRPGLQLPLVGFRGAERAPREAGCVGRVERWDRDPVLAYAELLLVELKARDGVTQRALQRFSVLDRLLELAVSDVLGRLEHGVLVTRPQDLKCLGVALFDRVD